MISLEEFSGTAGTHLPGVPICGFPEVRLNNGGSYYCSSCGRSLGKDFGKQVLAACGRGFAEKLAKQCGISLEEI